MGQLGRRTTSGVALIFTLTLIIMWSSASADPESGEAPARIKITEPRSGATVRGTSTIRVSIPRKTGVARIDIIRDNRFLDSVNADPFELAWNTQTEADGPHLLVAKLQALKGQWEVSNPVTVTVDNAPPTVTLKDPVANATIPGKTSLVAEAHDNLGLAEVQFCLDGSPIGSVIAAPYTMDWDPTGIANGPHLLHAKATDRAGNRKSSEPIPVLVRNPNRPPVITFAGSSNVLTVKEGELLSLTISAYDPDGPRDPLTFRATKLPPWTTLDEKTGRLSGTPDFSVASPSTPEVTYAIRIEACDPDPLCDSREITLKVSDINRPPVLAQIWDARVQEGTPLERAVAAKDPEGGPITYNMTRLPGWLTFDESSSTLRGTPGFAVASLSDPEIPYSRIRVEACNAQSLCTSQTFDVIVIDTNRPPAFELVQAVTANEGKLVMVEIHATDPDGDPLVITPGQLPDGADFFDDERGHATFRWPIRYDQAGEYHIPLTVAEYRGTLKDAESLNITINNVSTVIAGYIRKKDGTPLSRVIVDFTAGVRSFDKAVTNSKGLYLMKDLPPNSYIVRPQYTPSESKDPGIRSMTFEPKSRSVTLGSSDQSSIDFTAYPQTR